MFSFTRTVPQAKSRALNQTGKETNISLALMHTQTLQSGHGSLKYFYYYQI